LRKTGDLPVDQVLKSLVLRRHFLFRGQELQLFLFVFIGASHRNQQCRDCSDRDTDKSTVLCPPLGVVIDRAVLDLLKIDVDTPLEISTDGQVLDSVYLCKVNSE
jgi:hypothetical protein